MNNKDIKNLIKKSTEDHNKSFSYVLTDKFAGEFQDSLNMIYKSINSGGCIYTCGNGGSFSDAQHFTAELIVRYKRDRNPLSSLTLGCNASNLTACSNDYKYDEVLKENIVP